MPFAVTILTLFPEAFPGPLGVSILETARRNGVWSLETLDIRSFAMDKHRSVDAPPAGGGPGMVLRADILGGALDHAGVTALRGSSDRPAFLMTPRGAPLTQDRVRAVAQGEGLVIVCGRFEGVDQRVVEARSLEEVSVGDVVTAGGEAPAMTMVEACVRLLPGVIGDPASAIEESFEGGLLEGPQFARPRLWEGRDIPKVLLSGDHAAVDRWRRAQAEETTRLRRPDMWRRYLEARR